MKYLCKLIYDLEMTRHEANFVKKQGSIYMATRSFEQEYLKGQFLSLETISDSSLRQHLYERYQATVEQGRMQMMNVYVECAEAQRNKCQQLWDVETEKICENEKTLPVEKQLTPTMRQLIDQRIEHIKARIECLYKFKLELFQINLKNH